LLGLSQLTFHPSGTKRIAVDPAITSAVRKASQGSGSSFELMMASAQMESGLRPDAKSATSSAAGLFQFTEQTWLDTVRQHGAQHGMATEASAIMDQSGRLTTADPATRRRILNLRNDPSVASALAGDHMRDLSNKLSASLGRAVSSGEVYLGHFLGAHGAKQMITAPKNEIAANVLPEAARANSSLFYAQDGAPYTAGQFLQHIQKRLTQAFADIGNALHGDSAASSGVTPGGAAQLANASGSVAAFPNQGAGGLGKVQSNAAGLIMASLLEQLGKSDPSGLVMKVHHTQLDPTVPAASLTSLQMTKT
jgi:hypothetical protein